MSNDLAARVAAAQASTPNSRTVVPCGGKRLYDRSLPCERVAADIGRPVDCGTCHLLSSSRREPDLVALVTDLWNAYLTACDKADGRDRSEADVRRLTRELDEARAEVARLRALLPTTGPTWGEHCAGLGDEPTSTVTSKE